MYSRQGTSVCGPAAHHRCNLRAMRNVIRDLWAVLMVGRVRIKPLTEAERARMEAMMERLLPPAELARIRARRSDQ